MLLSQPLHSQLSDPIGMLQCHGIFSEDAAPSTRRDELAGRLPPAGFSWSDRPRAFMAFPWKPGGRY
jgi:hypothetical protein